eukprot:1160861-Pelagomonas_calceolata.AAC.4
MAVVGVSPGVHYYLDALTNLMTYVPYMALPSKLESAACRFCCDSSCHAGALKLVSVNRLTGRRGQTGLMGVMLTDPEEGPNKLYKGHMLVGGQMAPSKACVRACNKRPSLVKFEVPTTTHDMLALPQQACHDMSMHAVGNGHTLEGLVCPWGHAVSMHTVEGAHSGGCAPYPE